MSLIHNIIIKRPFDLSEIDELVLSIDGVRLQNRGEGTFYLWVDGKSSRGIDVTFEQGFIEIRNTILSNIYDYELTNKIVKELLIKSEGILLNEDNEEVSNFPIYHKDLINEIELHDSNVINSLLKAGEDITIYGPIRKVHFGKNLYQDFKKMKDKALKERMLDLILTVNYQIPNYEYGNVMQIADSEEDKKVLKLLTNETDCIIDKYDFILLNTNNERPIMITNEILNTMLPSNWLLVDEFTIVAPLTNQEEWKELLSKAERFNMWDEFRNN